MRKSTVKEIKERFDNDVERFSRLEIGQTSTVDAVLSMELLTQAASLASPNATHILDVGCGAGNYTLKLLEKLPHLNVTLIDLSKPMLDRASERISAVSSGTIKLIQGDIREIKLKENSYDIILAAAVLHHLRDDSEWESVFRKMYNVLRPSGGFWVFDLVEDQIPEIQNLMWRRYGDYLVDFKDEDLRDLTYGYIIQEDTPRSLLYQIDVMRKVGFKDVTILHKNLCYAAFGAIKQK
ncbi:class I SAM-dependent methyltransferase [Candidatus Bathyarchaeota archaeon]|nr:MAG: class I SAM-dependent methyltransferase [Candidatus Bathyarchaeota archaeon]